MMVPTDTLIFSLSMYSFVAASFCFPLGVLLLPIDPSRPSHAPRPRHTPPRFWMCFSLPVARPGPPFEDCILFINSFDGACRGGGGGVKSVTCDVIVCVSDGGREKGREGGRQEKKK
jgi:hypothetical protein